MDTSVIHDVKEFKEFRRNKCMQFFKEYQREPVVGFVPTMGALHKGHLSLVCQAKKMCDIVFCSIFVNPKQFLPHEDFNQYPRTLDDDLKQLNSIGGVDGVFCPTSELMYPTTPKYVTYVTINDVDNLPEGSCRPGFFRGVATVVLKLFHIVQPKYAFFGQKDCLQSIVVTQMVRDLNMDVEIIRCPIVREDDGLALSSRNIYLTPDQREISPNLYKSLQLVRELLLGGMKDIKSMKKIANDFLDDFKVFNVHYISFADITSGEELNGFLSEEQLKTGIFISLAAVIGKTRLIDNIIYPDINL